MMRMRSASLTFPCGPLGSLYLDYANHATHLILGGKGAFLRPWIALSSIVRHRSTLGSRHSQRHSPVEFQETRKPPESLGTRLPIATDSGGAQALIFEIGRVVASATAAGGW